jgi:hypothetical protein
VASAWRVAMCTVTISRVLPESESNGTASRTIITFRHPGERRKRFTTAERLVIHLDLLSALNGSRLEQPCGC